MPKGYGLVGSRGDEVSRLAHRFSWVIHFGPIPKGMQVLHTCDTPACVRPDHLFVGTQQDNMNDMATKSRGNGGGKKLSMHQASRIRELVASEIVHGMTYKVP